MNLHELDDYIADLQQSGFDTIASAGAVPQEVLGAVVCLIMALISVPFAFLVGKRGAMAGVGVSFAIAIAYWSINQLFEQIGNVNQLPPQVAAWAPDVIFALGGLYLLARIRT